MVYSICYALIFLAEILISLFYFENKFEKKAGKRFIIFSLIIVYILLYAFRLLNLSWVNLAAFFLCNFFLLYFCYSISIKSCIFHCCILLIFMTITESIVMFISAALFGTELFACLDDSLNLIIQSTISKLFYFLVIYFLSKLFSNKYKSENSFLFTPLLILPMSSILLLYAILYSLRMYNLEGKYIYLLMISIVLLLLSNIAMLWLYEFTLKIQSRNMELEFERQKEKLTSEYYKLLNEQNENSKIVMHDIKRHLHSIKEMAKDNAVIEYIDNFVEEFNIDKTVEYCIKPMVNSIVNRYKTMCDKLAVKMDIDIRNSYFDFLSDPDITALLDNMLENAVDAAKNTSNGFIDFSVFIRKNKYLSIIVTNSVNNIIEIKNNNIISSKKSGNMHGTGLKSIKRVVNKYDGEIKISFNEESMTFTSKVVFEIPK